MTKRLLVARALPALALVAGLAPGPLRAETPALTLASTTSTENSGLFAHLLPQFTQSTGIAVRVVAVGTGQALRIARNGDADVLLVHHRSSEEAFVAEGYGVRRHDVMYNDFVLVGPRADPARLRGLDDAAAALARIAAARAPFASRGDDSGTHKKELDLWAAAGLDPSAASGSWYRETGSGMGATLNAATGMGAYALSDRATGMGAYALSDRATWRAFRNKGDLEVLVEGDPRLFNPYGVILVNPLRHPHVHAREGQAFIDWLVSNEGQNAIAAYRLDGRQLFFPNAD